jgi:hypothetical protein
VHRSQLHATLYLPSGLNYLSSPSTVHLNSTGGKEWIICKAPLSKTNYKKMKFYQRSWSGRTQNITHLDCAMWFTTANFTNHKKNLSSPRLHISQLHVWWCWKISQSRQFNQ